VDFITGSRNRGGLTYCFDGLDDARAHSSRAFIIIVMTYLVALGDLPHGIAGSVDGFCLVVRGVLSWHGMLGGYLAPVLIGNIMGGVSLVAFLNHAQVATEMC
jgi:formate/nitrite transporter FocA (FNT family)